MKNLLAAAASLLAIALVPLVPARAAALFVLDPYILGATSLGDIDLPTLLPSIPDLSTVTAAGLVADNSSAAIALYRTTSNAAPVTFTVDGDATLLPYSATFLATAPAAGTTSVTVQPTSMFQIGTNFFAAVLVQAPPAGATPSFSTPLDIVATQGGSTTAHLPLVPPPVVVVHGLWGNGSSLKSVVDYLRGADPWSARPDLVQALEYDIDLAFDYSEPHSPPSRTPPATVLGSTIQSQLAALDDAKLVGGRVDVVAHSMGGLVSRYFATLPAYRGLADRGLGQFHAIVTIDTPERGSGVATFLIQHRDDKHISPPLAESTAVWLGACGVDNVSVMTCFDGTNMPLIPLSGKYEGVLKKGPVQPLDPGGAIRNLKTTPAIPGAIWRAVSAEAPSDSAIMRALNDLIAAIYTREHDAPTIDDILKNKENDAIVTVLSQRDDAPRNDFATLQNLSHTVAPDNFLLLMTVLGVHVDNANVTASDDVNRLVACWLRDADGADKGKSCIPSSSVIAANEPAPPARVATADRIRASTQGTAMVARPFELAIELSSAKALTGLIIHRNGKSVPFAVTRRVGNMVYAQVTPTHSGAATYRIAALFADNVLSVTDAKAAVQANPRPDSFTGDANFRHVRLGLEDGADLYALHPQASYASLPDMSIDVRDSAVYRIVAGDAVSVRADGTIVALHPGDATIEVRLGTVRDRIDVSVRALQH